MWAVTRCLYCSEDHCIHEFLFLNDQGRVFWTVWESEITSFDDYEEAAKCVEHLNFLYGFECCRVTAGPKWTCLYNYD